jgi:tRNA A-37 threonylcarbamoyl transferase component Bud32
MMNDSTPSPTHCPRCGATLPTDAPEGLCPRCLAALHFGPETAFTGAETAAAQPPLSPEELAPHFPQLEILECLGRGGMGVVYKARQKSLNRIVALKLLAPERVRDAKFAERFTGEAHALAKLNHPHIVTVHDFGEAGGFYYLLMEYVDGVNLRQAMKAGRFTPEQALAIVPPVCEALQYAHEHGIVHRDIKPENLLLDKEGRVKIADFGIAKMLDVEISDADGAETQAGTPQYMAPEQKEHRRTDHRADIYSLGVVLYEMLTGELPAEKLRPPSSRLGGLQIDVRLDEIVLRALEKTPELRYQTAADFRTQVETIAADAGKSGSGIPRAGVSSTASKTMAVHELRFSRVAIAGAVWLGLIFPMFFVMWTGVRVSTVEYHGPTWWQLLLSFTLLPLGATAPFGATILGWIAVAQIRRLPERLYGLGLAVFEGLAIPLLALDALIYFAGGRGLEEFWGASFGATISARSRPIEILLLCLCAAVDLPIIRRVWRAVRTDRSPAEAKAMAGRMPGEQKQRRPWLWFAMIAGSVLLLFVLLFALALILPVMTSPQPPLVTCTIAYTGDLNVYLTSMGSVLPPTPPSEIQENSRITVAFTLAADDIQPVLRKLKANPNRLRVEAYDRTMEKKIGEGLLTAMDNQIDASTGTIQCRAIIKAPEDMALLTNMDLNIRVLMETKHAATLLPLQAVQQNGHVSFVYLVRQDRRVTVRPVIVGTIDREVAEIKTGVAPGDTVVLDPTYKLHEGRAIRCKVTQHQNGKSAPAPSAEPTPSQFAQLTTSAPSTPAPSFPPAPAPAPSSIPTSTPPVVLTAETTTQDIQREALLIQLRQAREAAGQCEARYNTGAADASELVAANEKVDLLKAQIAGDVAQAASVRLKAAQQQAELAEARYKAGAMTFLEVEAARNAVELRRAELRDAKAAKNKDRSPTPTPR